MPSRLPTADEARQGKVLRASRLIVDSNPLSQSCSHPTVYCLYHSAAWGWFPFHYVASGYPQDWLLRNTLASLCRGGRQWVLQPLPVVQGLWPKSIADAVQVSATRGSHARTPMINRLPPPVLRRPVSQPRRWQVRHQ